MGKPTKSQINALIAKEITGWRNVVPDYCGSLDIALEAAGQHFTIVELTRKKYYDPGDVAYRAHVYHATFGAAHYSSQESMARALCMAMLEARNVSVTSDTH